VASVADFQCDKQAALAARPAATGPVGARDVWLVDGHVNRAKQTAHLASAVVGPPKKSDVGDEALLISEAVLISELLPTYEFVSSSSQLMQVPSPSSPPEANLCLPANYCINIVHGSAFKRIVSFGIIGCGITSCRRCGCR
jgi:hypothetical protein